MHLLVCSCLTQGCVLALIYEGAVGDVAVGVLSSALVKLYLKLNKAIGGLGWQGEDLVQKIALTPPVSVTLSARAIAAAALSISDEALFKPLDIEESWRGRSGFGPFPAIRDDGSAKIQQLAETSGTPRALKASAAILGRQMKEMKPSPTRVIQPDDDGSGIEGASSRGWRPLLYPLPIVTALLSVFAYIVSTIPDTAAT